MAIVNTLSFPVSSLLQVMAKGAGKTSTLNILVLTETLEAIGWSVKPTKAFARLTREGQFKYHPAIRPWLAAYRGFTYDYGESLGFLFNSYETAENGYKNFPVNVSPTPSTDFAELTVQRVDPPDAEWRDRAGHWRIVTLGWSIGVPAFVFTSKSGSKVTISKNVNPYDGRIADPNNTPMPSFWTWAYKNGLQQEAQDALAGAVRAPKPLAPGARTLDGTGTCPACMHNVKMTRERIMRHGWSVQGNRGRGDYGGSWHTGPCFGVGYEPWEISPKGAIDLVARLEGVLGKLNKGLQTLNAKPKEISNPRYEKRWPRTGPEILTPEDPGYDAALKMGIMRKNEEIKHLNMDITDTKVRIAAWVPKALIGRVASRWLRAQGSRGSGAR